MSMIFSFAGIEICCDFRNLPIVMDEAAASFLISPHEDVPLSYTAKELSPELLTRNASIKRDTGYELLRGDRGIFHLNHWASLRQAFGFFLEELEGLTTIYCHPELSGLCPMSASYFLSVIGLHRKLLDRDAMILHASYVEVQGEALLFLGPSGTGKSTQARLWETHGSAQTLNGDRALLRKSGVQWFVHGYPCCGSSHICVNRSLPLKAIILLTQDSRNYTEALSPSQKILALTSGAQFYPWASEEVQKVLSLAESLAREVPICKLHCTVDAVAVRCLQSYLATL